jgi:hypothetical protein
MRLQKRELQRTRPKVIVIDDINVICADEYVISRTSGHSIHFAVSSSIWESNL